ncbi:hypothetical protein HK101_010637 [Irineochytrium annulatum]|nr:hypothetical protein HK101_010637 [Irineochytrium annulatum]
MADARTVTPNSAPSPTPTLSGSQNGISASPSPQPVPISMAKTASKGAMSNRSNRSNRRSEKDEYAFKQSTRKHQYKLHNGNNANENWKDVLRWRASVLPHVLLPTFVLACWSTLVAVFYMVPNINFLSGRLPNSSLLITVLGVVMGLLLVFRTNTSYDRYWEGRRIWAITLTQIRNLSRLIWINVTVKGDNEHQLLENANQKRGAMYLIIAFASSIKYYLRFDTENCLDYADLGPFLAHLPEYSPSRETRAISKNLPLDLTLHLQAFVAKSRRTEAIDVPNQGAMTTALSTLVDCVSGFERIRDSPIPLAYSIHLKQTLMLYLLSLPFQLTPSIYWGAIPAVAIASFTLLGIEAIGGQIENPFGLDENDLPQDQYTDDIREEILNLMRGCETEPELVKKYDTETWIEPYHDLSKSHVGNVVGASTVVAF